MKIGIHVDSRDTSAVDVAERARIAEDAGFDTVWVGDRYVAPVDLNSAYPYRSDGVFAQGPDAWWMESVTSLAFIAAATSRIELGPGVLVLPLREPILLSKQLATIDAMSGGRVLLGIGSGWMREEFDAAGADYANRGRITDESVDVLRKAWTGQIELPLDRPPGKLAVRMVPTPERSIPIIVGGTSDAALRRAGRLGDGWYGLFEGTPDRAEIERCLGTISAAAIGADRNPIGLRIIVSLARVSGDPVPVAADLLGAGVGEVVVPRERLSEPGVDALVRAIHAL